jgi:hypothetical protein
MADETTLEVSPSIDTLVVKDLTNQILTTEGDTLIVPNDDISFITIGTPGPPGQSVVGPKGDQGEQGIQGIQGIPGSGGDKTFVHHEMSAALVWNITHNLDKYPSVTVVDSADTLVYGDVDYIDTNNLTVTFTASFAGKAYLN